MAGILRLTLNSIPNVGDSISINLRYLTSQGTYNMVYLPMLFVSKRASEKQATVGFTISMSTLHLANALGLDYRNIGGTDNIKVELESTTVIKMTLNNASWEFVGVSQSGNFLDYEIENVVAETPKTMSLASYDVPNSTCDLLMGVFEVTGGTELYNAYVDGVQVASGVPSPVSIQLERDTSVFIKFTDTNNVDIGSRTLKIPRKYIPEDISVSIDYVGTGASLNVKTTGISSWLWPQTYSIDGVNFTETNVFTGQPEGTVTVYVRDVFGCVTSKDIIVDGHSTVTETFIEISDINPIRYSIVNNGKKNRYNTLSHEQLKNVAYPFDQPFTVKDKPVTQLRTNAKILNVFALDCDGVKHPINTVQRSEHLGQTIKATATKFSNENNRMGIYFGVTDILDPITGDLIETKDFGYQVPYGLNVVGRFIYIEGLGTVPVSSVAYDEEYEAFVLLFDVVYTGDEQEVEVSATYNVQNYEIFEFVADIASLPEEFYIVIEAGMTSVEHTFMSEKIRRVEESKSLTEIIYWNTTNTGGMNYATGVVHTLRLYNVLSRIAGDETLKGFNGDTERYNTNHEVFDGEEYIFNYLSEEMARKLRLILTHDRLFINGVLLKLSEASEIDSRFTTNMCSLTAIMSKGGNILENLNIEIIEPINGEFDDATYELEQAIAAAKGKALILWKK